MRKKVVIFDWGDTVMRDFSEFSGPMVDWPRVEIIDGIEESLALISSQFITCLASNAGNSNAELMGLALERVGIRGYFTHLFTSKELGYNKPDSNFFKEIISRIGVNPSECIMIGNDYERDIVSSKMAGMETILYTEKRIEEPKQLADFVIRSMNDLIHLLNTWGD
ncbi:HAD family hydrolase [Desulfitobacterium metallireducens]|uniref:HAD family hydrolase n=1 Tax=Desulfitobacterium metallireducens DSM 15288 TaxID=871968 RepID=W0EGU3_9FIRM|nr:HAD family hydrolase [Desulfitobacterium metallireducens]AHF08424.1 hypothetical protein DESME_02350 [Desulfitobacterium metallireducens DSM 15288]